jgi:NADH-quinone oxidoreductase subunit N
MNIMYLEKPLIIALVLILTGFFLKLGIVPYYSWVPGVYEKTSHFNFLLLNTIVKIGFYFAFLNFIINLLLKSCFIESLLKDLFIIAGVGSTVSGSLLLITRNSVKGFIAANSIISWGVLCLNISSNFISNIL